jgi:hypothetical protein
MLWPACANIFDVDGRLLLQSEVKMRLIKEERRPYHSPKLCLGVDVVTLELYFEPHHHHKALTFPEPLFLSYTKY